MRYLEKCLETTVNENVVRNVDLAKAFDSVPHLRLLGKLESYGVTGNILNWIKAFLSGRSQVVRVNDTNSMPVPVLSSIPVSRDDALIVQGDLNNWKIALGIGC